MKTEGVGTKRCGLAAMIAVIAAVMVGCAGYGNYPTSNGYKALDSPNAPHMSEVTRRAVVAAVDRAGISGPYAIRLPRGMDATRRARVLEALNDPNARLLGDDEEATDLPVFVVERVIVRVNHAEVDVAIPIAGVEWPDGSTAQQLTTYYLKGGFGRWRVTRMRTWSVGVRERAIVDGDRAEQEEQAERDAVAAEETEPDSDEPPF